MLIDTRYQVVVKISPDVVDIRVFCSLFVVCVHTYICSAGYVELLIVLLYQVSTSMLGVSHAIQNEKKL